MNSYIFHIVTKFHYEVANFISLSLKDSDNYLFLFSNNSRSNRLKNVKFINNHCYSDSGYDESEINQVIDFLNNTDNKINYLTFLNHSFESIYIIKNLNNNVNISLLPDGIAAYTKYNSFFSFTDFKLTLNYFNFLWRNKYNLKKFSWITTKHGRNFNANYYYIFEECLLPYVSKKSNFKNLNLNFKNFNIDKSIDFKNLSFSKVCLIVGQNLPDTFSIDLSLIYYIINKLPPSYQIVYKPHPTATKRFDYLSFKVELKKINVYLIEEDYAIENYISKLKKSLVLSAFSTSMLFRNNSCSYAWYYKIHYNSFTYNGKVSYYNPTKHITVLSNHDELNKFIQNV